MLYKRLRVFNRTIMMITFFLGSLAIAWTEQPLSIAVAGPSFRFTATADSRSERTNFRNVLSQIMAQVGDEGVFHISCGDIDPLQDNYDDLVNQFGHDIVWFPVVGNHEAETPEDMSWIRAHYSSLPWIVNPGPTGCENTSYSFDCLNAHFIVINEYYDGHNDTGTDGDVVDVLYDWLAADLAATTKPAIFVFGHEPAYPFNRHVGDSLDEHQANRDRFWNLLEEPVIAYLCGHSHYYTKYRHEDQGVWQIDLGNAGNTDGDLLSFLDVTIDESQVRFDIWRGTTGPYSLTDSWTVDIGLPRVSTTISCAVVEHTIAEGDSVTISGSINPPLSGEAVTLTYKKPDGTTYSKAVITGSDGYYVEVNRPDVAGTWEVVASWVADEKHSARTLISFRVAPAFPWALLIGGIGGAVTIIVVIVVLKRRRPAA